MDFRQWISGFALLTAFAVPADWAEGAEKAKQPPVSYTRQIRPLFQARCQGCHQPAKAGGGYVMTDFAKLLGKGDSDQLAVAPGKPAESELLRQILVAGGKAKMPKKGAPLADFEIELVRRWIAEGAKNDSPAAAHAVVDAAHPPVYTRPPVVTAIDYSPDGKLLAVAGFHEVLLVDANDGRLLSRLVGLSERIQSVRFSPKGDSLAAVGGNPSRMGEIQVWDVAKRKLTSSIAVGFDTVYGASWSPDGRLVAVGCADNNVRAFDVKTGEQALQQGAHTDWVLDTVFNKSGTHLVSVSRDMTAKLTEVATQRFVDNITSITPGALKGGYQAVDRHPVRDEVVAGGSDGQPKVYRLFRTTARQIGDDANLIRRFPTMPGRVFSVAVSSDGKRAAAGSALDNHGWIGVFPYEDPDPKAVARIKALESKRAARRSPAEKAELEKLRAAHVEGSHQTEVSAAGVYTVAFRPDGLVLAAAGSDGLVRLVDCTTGKVVREFSPAPVAKAAAAAARRQSLHFEEPAVSADSDASSSAIASIEVSPPKITLSSAVDYTQILVTAKHPGGESTDVTRNATYAFSKPVASATPSGVVRPASDGSATLTVSIAGKSTVIPVEVRGFAAPLASDFVREAAPLFSRMGCNAGTCHGSAKGKNGFKLSLRGYDPLFDVRALTDDLASRRVNVAAPDESLMLLKTSGAAPHAGGQLTKQGEPYYETLRAWIAAGAKLNVASTRVAKIEISPTNPMVERIGARQQLRIVATYPDGRTRDVTREAFIDSGNGEVAAVDRFGLASAIRRGEAPILARYEGAYASTTLTVMGDRRAFAWKDFVAYNRIDELTAAKWKRLKIAPSELCTDAEFLRRATLDLTGLPPTADDVRAFLADPRESRVKRAALVEKLIGGKEFIEHWTNKWADLLQVNRKFLGPEGAAAFRAWIRKEVAGNTPYDQFVHKVLTASGSNKENPAASYFKILRDPTSTMENTTHLFMAVRFNCNKCHDHPFERWTQDQYYQTAAYFSQVGLKADPASGDRKIGGTDVEAPKPYYEVVYDMNAGEVKHDRTGQPAAPSFPFAAKFTAPAKASRRELLADWITSVDNQFFAKSYVNRLWGYMFGSGIIEPIDDIRAGNPASNPELLDYLTREFVASKFDARKIMKLICQSRTYQLSIVANRWNEDDRRNFSHMIPKRLPAEVLYDATYRTLGATSNIPGVAPGTRAAELPDVGVELPSGFLAAFGRPVRESACECERSSGLQLGPVMALINGQTVAEAIADGGNAVAKLVSTEKDDGKLINELFLRILNRPATPAEIHGAAPVLKAPAGDHQKLVAALKTREAEVAPIRAKRAKEREDEIARAKTELAAYEKQIAPAVAAAEKQRQEKIHAAEKTLAAYEKTLHAKLEAFEKDKKADVKWTVLKPKSLRATNGAKLTLMPDGSIYSEGKLGRGSYFVVADTDLKGITGVRLELIADERLPAGGPGRAGDGNFVLTQFTLQAKSKKNLKTVANAQFANPQADFSQDNFPVAAAVDGSPNGGKGWAVYPRFGVTHWAVFELKQPLGFDGGTELNFRSLHQFGGGEYTFGRYRISVTTAKTPIPLGLSDVYRQIIATPPAKRTRKQQEELTRHVRLADAQFAKLDGELNMARQPLPTDPRLVELRGYLAAVSQPLREDPKLLQLRRDVEFSTKQAAQSRLTGAQDLAWALINSPAFLFNR